MDEKEFFDHLAPTWDDNEVLSTPDKVRFVLGFMNLKRDKACLISALAQECFSLYR